MNQVTDLLCHPPVVRDWDADAWNRFLPLVRQSRLTGRCLAHLEQHDLLAAVPPRILDHLRGGDIQARYVRGQAVREWRQVSRVMSQAGIDIMPLKGLAYVLEGLPPSHWRGMSDIDVLVRKADVAVAEQALKAAGWGPSGEFDDYDRHYYAAWMHEVPPLSHPRRGVEVDLHHNLAPPVSRIKIAPEVLWEGSRVVDDPDGKPLRVLAATDLVIHNAVHLFMNDELRGGLRDVVDFRDLFNHFVASEFEFGSHLLARAQQLGCGRPLYYATDTAVRLAGLSPDPVFLAGLKQQAPPLMQRELMRRLIDRLLAPARPGIRSAAVAERLLFIRSHWIRMPPLMLARHLARKALKSKAAPGAEPDLPG